MESLMYNLLYLVKGRFPWFAPKSSKNNSPGNGGGATKKDKRINKQFAKGDEIL